MIQIDIPLYLADSIAGALYSHADMYRRSKGDSEDVKALREAADQLETIAENIGIRAAKALAAPAKVRP